MAKKIVKVLKMELPGGEAKPGPKLASAGVQMAKFCTDFNAKTADRRGQTVPVIITAYEDKSFSFEIKTSPVAGLILNAQLEEIAQYKMPDLNANDIEAAKRIVAGSARQMGVEVVD